MKNIKSKKFRILCSLFLTLAIVGVQDMDAQRRKRKSKKDKKEVVVPKKPKSKKKSIASLTKSSKKIEGLFTVYQDTITGTLKMVIKKEQLNKDYIYFSQIADGIAAVGAFRGNYKGSTVFNVKKFFDKIEFIAPNTAFYFDKKNATFKIIKSKY